MGVGDKVIEKLLGMESIVSTVEILCNIVIFATSAFLQCLIFNIKEAELLEITTEGEVDIDLVVVEHPGSFPGAANHRHLNPLKHLASLSKLSCYQLDKVESLPDSLATLFLIAVRSRAAGG